MSKLVLDRNNTNFPLEIREYIKKLKLLHSAKDKSTWSFLKCYQNIIRHFINEINIGARGLLLYHDMGIGKTLSAVSIAMDLMDSYPPIILLAKSLQTNFYQNIIKYIKLRTENDSTYSMGKLSEGDIDKYIKKNFSFVSLNAGNMIDQMITSINGDFNSEFDKALSDKIDKIVSFGTLDNRLLIIDEAHNLFRAVTNGSKNAIALYDMIVVAKNLKVILLTGTPIANNPFELSICFNILAGTPTQQVLHENYYDFYNNFIHNGNIINKYKFQNRILGLVSRVTMSSNVSMPNEKETKLIFVPMENSQYTTYLLARDKEIEESSRGFGDATFKSAPALQKPRSQRNSSYRVHSRQISNFDPKDLSSSPKMKELMKRLDVNGINLIYSQFIGAGGIEAMEKYLLNTGWKKYQLEPKIERATIVGGTVIMQTSLEKRSCEKLPDFFQGRGEDQDDNRFNVFAMSADEAIKRSKVKLNKYKREGRNRLIVNRKRYKIKPNMGFTNRIIDNIQKNTTSGINDSIISFDLSIRNLRNSDLKKIKLNEKPKYPVEIYIIEHHSIEKKIVAGYFKIKYSDEYIEILDMVIFKPYHNINLEQLIFYKVIALMDKSLLNSIIYKGDSSEIKKALIKFGMKKTPENYLTYENTMGGKDVPIKKEISQERATSIKYFATITGEHNIKDRQFIQNIVNSPKNKNGEVINTLLVSSIGAEGLDLKNVRTVHIFEPYWNYGRINQIKARAVRIDSHSALPNADRTVQPYVYLSVKPTDDYKEIPKDEWRPPDEKLRTTDEDLFAEAISGQILIDKFLSAIDETAIECLGDETCITCTPNNVPLFINDLELDMVKGENPCKCKTEKEVMVNEIKTNDGTTYYFKKNNKSLYGISIFEFNALMGGYVEIPEDDDRFQLILDEINKLT